MIASLAALALSAAPLDEESVLAALDEFFIALEQADTDAFREMMTEDVVLQTVRLGPDGAPRHSVTAREDWLSGLEGQGGKIVELYWKPEVNISPIGLANAWVPYYIEYEGNPIHCGIDNITLVSDGTRWRIAALQDTRDPDGCERLGMPGRSEMRPQALREKLSLPQ